MLRKKNKSIVMTMITEDKQIFLVDLCGRLPYGIIGEVPHYDKNGEETLLQGKITGFNEEQIKFEYLPDCSDDIGSYNWFDIDLVKLYLRPMSSMTEEERKTLNNILEYQYYSDDSCMCEASDWLNAHHFDYRGLIPKGLAIEVSEENNPYRD